MRAVDEVPRWDRLVHPLASALNFAFGCRHRHLSPVFTIEGQATRFAATVGRTSTIHRTTCRSCIAVHIEGFEFCGRGPG
jgi:hypothetical protein